jgi:hypothetical protein
MLLTLRSLYEVTAYIVTAAGVAASPVVGAGTFNVGTPVPSVSAIAAVGVGTFNSDFSSRGVVAGANVGVARFNASFTTSGVAADPEIGTGTVETPPFGQVTVHLTGVAASPAIGSGTVLTPSVVTYSSGGATDGGRPWPTKRAQPRRIEIPRTPAPVTVTAKGVRCYGRNGKLRFNAQTRIAPVATTFHVLHAPATIAVSVTGDAVTANLVAGNATIKTVIDLTLEEIITLMEAA